MAARFDPERQGWPCRAAGFCSGVWFSVGDALVCQCSFPRCRRVLAVVTQAVPPAGLSPGALAALQSQARRVESDFDGCVE